MKIRRRKRKQEEITKALLKAEETEKELTPKQQRFVKLFAVNLNATKSYQIAYDCKKALSAASQSWKLLQMPHVMKAMDKELTNVADGIEMDQKKVQYFILRNFFAAFENKQFMASQKAADSMARIFGMFIDRLITESDIRFEIAQQMDTAGFEVVKTLERLAGASEEVTVESEEKVVVKKRRRKLKFNRGNGKGKEDKDDGGNNYKVLYSESPDSTDEDSITPIPSISTPDWKPLNRI